MLRAHCVIFGCSLSSVMASSWGKMPFFTQHSPCRITACLFCKCLGKASGKPGILLRFLQGLISHEWDSCKAQLSSVSAASGAEHGMGGRRSLARCPKTSLSPFPSVPKVLFLSPQIKTLLTTAEEQGDMINRKVRAYLSLAQPALF